MTKNLVSEIYVEEEKANSMRHGINHDDANNNRYGEQQEHKHHNQYQQQQQSISNQYNVNLQYDSITPEAGRRTKLILSVTEQRSGEHINEFEVIHNKLMHLIIVGDDLSYFAHIHPRFEAKGEIFTIVHTFPESGKYKLWIDFKPKDGNQTLVAFMINVTGNPVHIPITLVYDKKYIKESSDRKYQISLKLAEKLATGTDVDMVFRISDISGKPITDLEPLMGAGGHSVIISSDIKEFLHVHPTEEVDPISWKGGPDISFRANFPKRGLYKAWVQFQHQGKLVIADFSLDVT
jgi:hypothetical protein